MCDKVRCCVATVGVLLLGIPSVARGQQVAGSPEQLQGLLTPGALVTVTSANNGEISGRVADLSSLSLTLLVGDQRRDVPVGEIRMIRERRRDSLINGAVFGALVGVAGTALAFAGATCDGCSWDPEWYPAAMAALVGGIGAGVGVGIDALVRREQLIYSVQGTSSSVIRIAPLSGGQLKGVRVSIAF